MAKKQSGTVSWATSEGWDVRAVETARGERGEVPEAWDPFLANLTATKRWQIEQTLVATLKSTRSEAASAPLTLDVEGAPDDVYIVMTRYTSGAIRFHMPSEPARRGRQKSTRTLYRFSIPVPASVPESGGRRGFISAAIKAVLLKVAGNIADYPLAKLALLWETATWKLKGHREGWISVTADGLVGHQMLSPAELSSLSTTERNLLFLHGTFSNTTATFNGLAKTFGSNGKTLFQELQDVYGNRIYGFDHFTLSRTPEENVRMLLDALPDRATTFDVITHSRGGLVLRHVVEQRHLFGALADRFVIGRAVLVASPNEGTPLASPDHLTQFINWLSNVLELFPENPFTTGMEFVSEALSWIALRILGGLPGLASMDYKGKVIRLLQAALSPPGNAYSAMVANFEPESTIRQRIFDAGADLFFPSANDILMPTEGGWRVEANDGTAAAIPGDRVGCFGLGGNLFQHLSVNHINFFEEPSTVDFLVRALRGQSQPVGPMDVGHELPFGKRRGTTRIERQPLSPPKPPHEQRAPTPLAARIVNPTPQSQPSPPVETTVGPQAQTVRRYHVFIASPSDVNDERNVVRTFFKSYNLNFAEPRGLHFEVIDWENYSSAGAGRPQELITEQTLQKYRETLALVIGIMNQRFGSHSGTNESGTEEEFEWAITRQSDSGFPEVKWFFRNVEKVSLDPIDPESGLSQWKKVRAFRARIEGEKKLYSRSYKDLDEFRSLLENDIGRWLNSLDRPWSNTSEQPPLASSKLRQLIDASSPYQNDEEPGTVFQIALIQSRSDDHAVTITATFQNDRVIETLETRATKATMSRRNSAENRQRPWHEIIATKQRIHGYINGDPKVTTLPGEVDLYRFGSALFSTLFPGQVRRLYDAARSEQRGRRVNLIFISDSFWIASLPWEFIYDPERHAFPALEEVNFTRNVLTSIPAEPISVRTGPIRILVVVAQPLGLGALSMEEEADVIRSGFRRLLDAGLAEVELLLDVTPELLHRTLESAEAPIDVLHFIGHGEYNEQSDCGYLIFENQDGGEQRLDSSTLRQIVCRRGIRLVCLNACETGRGGRQDFSRSVAQALIAGGVPAVVANEYPVLDVSATAFSRHFYWALAMGHTIGDAAREARATVNHSISGEAIDWAVPVVFARNPVQRICIPRSATEYERSRTAWERQRRRAMQYRTKIGVWNAHRIIPHLPEICERLTNAQNQYAFETVSFPAPIGIWRREQEKDQAFVVAETLYDRLKTKPTELGIDILICMINFPIKDARTGYLYYWHRDPLIVTSTFGLLEQLNEREFTVERMMAHLAAAVVAGIPPHPRRVGPADCPLFYNDQRDIRSIAGRLTFCASCRKQFKDKAGQERLRAAERILTAYP